MKFSSHTPSHAPDTHKHPYAAHTKFTQIDCILRSANAASITRGVGGRAGSVSTVDLTRRTIIRLVIMILVLTRKQKRIVVSAGEC
ncbi:hypothetical protein CICLE_v10006336mg [Citrus x clementina]|uniref:Uncharacterized protein n=1 Tax=Citrus clementina TaxID=85681 RepID=V4S3P2_CITCL|nr:hypothetical protein CICLE_v10006336mg [Citrus x clementina]